MSAPTQLPAPPNPPGQGNVENTKFVQFAMGIDMFGKPVIVALDSTGQLWLTRTKKSAAWEQIPGPLFPMQQK